VVSVIEADMLSFSCVAVMRRSKVSDERRFVYQKVIADEMGNDDIPRGENRFTSSNYVLLIIMARS